MWYHNDGNKWHTPSFWPFFCFVCVCVLRYTYFDFPSCSFSLCRFQRQWWKVKMCRWISARSSCVCAIEDPPGSGRRGWAENWRGKCDLMSACGPWTLANMSTWAVVWQTDLQSQVVLVGKVALTIFHPFPFCQFFPLLKWHSVRQGSQFFWNVCVTVCVCLCEAVCMCLRVCEYVADFEQFSRSWESWGTCFFASISSMFSFECKWCVHFTLLLLPNPLNNNNKE